MQEDPSEAVKKAQQVPLSERDHSKPLFALSAN